MRRPTRTQIVLVLGVIFVAGAVSWDYLALRAKKMALVGQLEAFGTASRNPDAVRDVTTETDGLRAGLKAARLLLAEELDPRWLAELSPAARASALASGEAKLEMSRDLALEVLETRPTSWQALMILGGSRYLLAVRRSEPGRWTDRSAWEKPLTAALARAPLQPEPKRILSAAYLNEWSILSQEEREQGLELLRDAFTDLDTLDQLLPAWLLKAESFSQALSVVPADPRAWRQLDHFYRQREDWQRLARVLERWDESMPDYLDNHIEKAQRLIEAGNASSARANLMAVIREMPRRSEYADHFGEAIRLLPPGPTSSRESALLRNWVEWAGDRCLMADCPWPPPILVRLTNLARAELPSRRAHDELLRGNLNEAVATEERSMLFGNLADWTPYLLLKSKIVGMNAQARLAKQTLEKIPLTAGNAPLIEHVRRQISAERLPASHLIDTGWSGDGRVQRRLLLTPEPLQRIEVGFESVGAGGDTANSGATVEVRVNQRLEGFHAIRQGTVLRLAVEPPSDHLLIELLREAGAVFRLSESI